MAAHTKTFIMTYSQLRNDEEKEYVVEIEAYSYEQASYFARQLCEEQGSELRFLEVAVARTA